MPFAQRARCRVSALLSATLAFGVACAAPHDPSRDRPSSYPFRGDEELDLQAAMEMMREMQRIDDLERVLDLLQWSRLNEFKRTRIPR